MSSAIDQAAEALRPFAKMADLADHDPSITYQAGPGIAYWRKAREALAHLEAEKAAVPPDRERLAKILETAVALVYMGNGKFRDFGPEAAAALRLPADGWRPIESAPKDGREILVCHPDGSEEWFMAVVFYDESTSEDSPDHCWHKADGLAYHRDFPTYWMPLPSPPEEPKT